MASFSTSLEQALRRALQYANERSHEYATLEHLLLSLIDDRDAAAVMRACDVDIDVLRDKLTGYIDNELSGLVLDTHGDAQPTAGFQRVIHRAVAHVQSSGREEVTGANVLVAIFAERESHAAFFLQEQHMTRFDAVNYISHGIAKRAGMSEPRAVRGVDEDAATVEGGEEKKRGACQRLQPRRKRHSYSSIQSDCMSSRTVANRAAGVPSLGKPATIAPCVNRKFPPVMDVRLGRACSDNENLGPISRVSRRCSSATFWTPFAVASTRKRVSSRSSCVICRIRF